jgi:hypothetical protein
MLKISFLACVFLFLTAGQPTVSAQSNQNQPASRSATPNQQAPASTGSPPVEAQPVSNPSATNGPASYHQQPANEGPKITDWLQVLTSVALLAVIIVQACIYNKQRVLMWKQWIAMRRGVIQTHELVKQNLSVIDLIGKQEGHLSTQAQAAVDGVEENKKMVETMKGQLDAINKQEGHLFAQAEAAGIQAGTMKEQLEAIKTQSELAEKSIAHAEQSSIYANRAYVLAKIRNQEPYQFKLAIENGGNTPANNVRVSYTCRVMEKDPWRIDEQTGQVVYDAGFDITVRLGVIAPNGSHETIWTVAFTPHTEIQKQEWRDGVKLFCWGRISYEDIFKKDRHTDFCFYKSERQPEGYHSEYGNEAW